MRPSLKKYAPDLFLNNPAWLNSIFARKMIPVPGIFLKNPHASRRVSPGIRLSCHDRDAALNEKKVFFT